MKSKYVVALVVVSLLILPWAIATPAQAQTVSCPAGYTCTPASVSCPPGYICTPVNQPPGCPAGYICQPISIPIPPVSDATVTVIGSPTLALAYDSAQKESSLTATFNLNVTAGHSELYLYTSMANVNLLDQNGNAAPAKVSVVVAAGEKSDAYGRNYTILASGNTVRMTVTLTADPKQLFAGSYHGFLSNLYVFGSDINNLANLYAPSNHTNEKVIIGELSPYITGFGSSQPFTPGQRITAVGQRLDTSGGVFIDGIAITTGVIKEEGSNIISFLLPASLTDGYHVLQIKSNMTGASNNVGFQVQSGTPVSGATVTVNGSPTLALTYDSSQKESALTAIFDISVTAGTQGVNVYQYSSASFFTQAGASASVNSINRPPLTPITAGVGTIVDYSGNKYFIVPAGQTIKLRDTLSVDPKQLFAGTYYASESTLSGFAGTYSGNLYSLNFDTNKTNTKTVVGEVSPYITGFGASQPFTSGSGVTVIGQRLDTSGGIFIDGVAITTGVKGDSSNIGFLLPTSLTDGYHVLQIKSNMTGWSNSISFQVGSGNTQSSVKIFSAHTLASSLPGSSYKVTGNTISITKESGAKYYLASNSNLAPYIVDDYVKVNGTRMPATGSYTWSTGVNGLPIEKAYANQGSTVQDVTNYLVNGNNTFEIWDNGGFGYGWTDVYLVKSTQPVVQPSITVSLPMAEKGIVTAGNTYTINWQSGPIPPGSYVNSVRVYKGSQFLYDVVPSASGYHYPASGSADWIVSSSHITGTDFRIQVSLTDQNGSQLATGYSSYFTIVSGATTQPSITVLSPNGGENYKSGAGNTGDMLNWKFDLKNNLSRGDITIFITSRNDANWRSGTYFEQGGARDVPPQMNPFTGGSSQLNERFSTGKYYLFVEWKGYDGSYVSDFSDAPFIVTSTSQPSLPDLVVTDIVADQTYVRVNYMNKGGSCSGTCDLLVRVATDKGSFGGNTAYRFPVPASGQSAQTGGFSLSLVGLKPGDTSKINAIVDWEGRVNESDENNNTLGKTLTIPGGPVVTPNSVTVTLPKGGENYQPNDKIPVSWIWKGASAPRQPTAYVIDASTGNSIYTNSLNYNANATTQTGTVPPIPGPEVRRVPFVYSFPLGTYKMKICDAMIDSTPAPVCGVSAGTFVVKNQTQAAVATISLDAASPLTSNIPVIDATSGQYLGLPVLIFDVNAQGDSLHLHQVSISVQTSGTGNVSAAYLYQGSTLVASAAVSGNVATFSNITNGTAGATIPQNSTLPYTVKVDAKDVTSGTLAITASLNVLSSGNAVIYNPQDVSAQVTGSAKGNTQTVVAPGPLFTLVGSPTITITSINDGVTPAVKNKYTATFNVNVLAVGNDITLGLPSSGYPAFSGSGSRIAIYKNGAPESSNYDAVASYSKPTNTTLSPDGTAFVVSRNQSVTIPVTFAFIVTNPGANTYALQVVGIGWSSAAVSNQITNFMAGLPEWRTNVVKAASPNYASSASQSQTASGWNAFWSGFWNVLTGNSNSSR